MRPSSVLAAALAIVTVATIPASPAAAQQPVAPGKALRATAYTGYTMFGRFIDGPLGTSVRSSGAPTYGAQLGLALAPGVALLGHIASARGDLQVGVPLLGGVDVGETRALLADASLEVALPAVRTSGVPLVPFVQAGVGVIRYDLALGVAAFGMPIGTRATNLAGNVGIGADVPIGGGVALRLLAKDYIGKFDFRDAVGVDFGAAKVTHSVGLSAGVRVEF